TRQDDGDRPVREARRDRFEEQIGGWPDEVHELRTRKRQCPVSVDEHVPIRRCDEDGARPDAVTLIGLRNRQTRLPAQQVCHETPMMWIEMLNDKDARGK